MKYRPLASTGAAVSCLCLKIGYEEFARGSAALKTLIIAGLEAGINAYHFEIAHPTFLQAAGEALSHVDRSLVWVSLGLGGPKSQVSADRSFLPEDLTRTVEEGLHTSGLGWFDVVVLNDPDEQELSLASLNTLKALRSSGQVRMLGIMGEAPVIDTYISTGAFDALYTPCSINPDTRIRSRMREALRRDLIVFVYDYDREVRTKERPKIADDGGKKGLFGWMGKKPQAPTEATSSFEFLHTTPGWTAEELCLGLVLTDPTVSSALISARSDFQIEQMAQAIERHLPSRIAAQIEMARVG